MSAQNRIEPTSIAVSVPRQTPHQEFGAVLSEAMGSVVQGGAALVGGALGGPVTTAAVSAARGGTLVRAAGAGMASVTAVGGGQVGGGGAPAAGTATGGLLDAGASDSALLAQVSTSDPSSAAYLQLQMRMQQESQQFSAASNVLKVRSDSAKAAINNIR